MTISRKQSSPQWKLPWMRNCAQCVASGVGRKPLQRHAPQKHVSSRHGLRHPQEGPLPAACLGDLRPHPGALRRVRRSREPGFLPPARRPAQSNRSNIRQRSSRRTSRAVLSRWASTCERNWTRPVDEISRNPSIRFGRGCGGGDLDCRQEFMRRIRPVNRLL